MRLVSNPNIINSKDMSMTTKSKATEVKEQSAEQIKAEAVKVAQAEAEKAELTKAEQAEAAQAQAEADAKAKAEKEAKAEPVELKPWNGEPLMPAPEGETVETAKAAKAAPLKSAKTSGKEYIAQWTLHYDNKRYVMGDKLTLSDDDAEDLVDAGVLVVLK